MVKTRQVNASTAEREVSGGQVAKSLYEHFAGVIAKCETQQRPFSQPIPKSFYFD